MIERITLDSSMTIELAMPKGGFSDDFLSAVREKLAKCEGLDFAYVLLKKVEQDDSAIFFCFMFRDGVGPAIAESRIASSMGDISSLFADKVALDAVCLNGRADLLTAVQSVGEPAFRGG
jgi:hypothetical protein